MTPRIKDRIEGGTRVDWYVLTFFAHASWCKPSLPFCTKQTYQLSSENWVEEGPDGIDCTSESCLIGSCQGSEGLVPPARHRRAPAEESDTPTATCLPPPPLILPDWGRVSDSTCQQTRASLAVWRRRPHVGRGNRVLVRFFFFWGTGRWWMFRAGSQSITLVRLQKEQWWSSAVWWTAVEKNERTPEDRILFCVYETDEMFCRQTQSILRHFILRAPNKHKKF